MQGKIIDGALILSEIEQEGYKLVVYAEIPEFDQSAQYVVQSAPVDMGEHIYMGVEVLELPEQEDDGEMI